MQAKTPRRSSTLAADRLAKVIVRRPQPSEVPGWSPNTLELFARLSPLERGFVEWYATGASAAEAYRRAAGRDATDGTDASRQLGYKIRVRPRVQAAVDSALRDQNFDARCDRQWVLMKLMAVVDKCEESHEPSAIKTLIAALRLIAKLKGLLAYRPSEVRPDGMSTASTIQTRVEEIMADARRRIEAGARHSATAVRPVVRVSATHTQPNARPYEPIVALRSQPDEVVVLSELPDALWGGERSHKSQASEKPEPQVHPVSSAVRPFAGAFGVRSNRLMGVD